MGSANGQDGFEDRQGGADDDDRVAFEPRRGIMRPIELDAALDTGLFKLNQTLGRGVRAVRTFFDRFKVRGPR
ncbi:MAG: hypothetical protein KI785_15245, partial [Devosiaceae bacterium]|nr:hypothetical protein [Devosiaceae bacterium MH13]